MIWLAVRQCRAALLASAALVAAIVSVLVVTGVRARGLAASVQAACRSTPDAATCAALQSQLLDRYQGLVPYLGYVTITSVLVATFWGAPMVAREVETGTADVAWSQSITRRRWLAHRVGVPAVALTVLGLLLGFGITWWLGSFTTTILGDQVYGVVWMHGPLLPAMWLFALALGLLVGTVVRRTVPAMAIAAVLAFALAITANLATSLSTVSSTGPAQVVLDQLLEAVPILLVAAGLTAVAFRRVAQVRT